MDKELRDLNRQLAPLGRRICAGCGRQHPLTAEFWYFSRKGRDRLTLRPSHMCRECSALRQAIKDRERYRKEKTFRDYKAAYRRAYFAVPANRQHHRVLGRDYMRAKRAEQKRRRFAALIGVRRG
jgi:hypothetical protein